MQDILGKIPTRQFFNYAAVGLIGTFVHYSVLWSLVEYRHLDSIYGSVCGFVAGAFTNYVANYYITFKSRKNHTVALPQFFSVAVAGLFVNTLVVALGTRWLGWHYLLSQLLATGLVLILTFLGNKYWTFRHGGIEGSHANE
jgi:putative flippase GtrA